MSFMSDPLVPHDPPPQCPPSPDVPSDSDDAFNTAEARIHFGPPTSPEKRLSAIFARKNSLHPESLSPPLRRSPRLSSPQPRSPKPESEPELLLQEETDMMQVIEQDDNLVHDRPSGEVTPDVDQALQDEPPSILAIRISRAHDNPSPPPSPPPTHLGLANTDVPSSFLPLASLTAALLSPNASDTGSSTPTSDAMPNLSRDGSPAPTAPGTSRTASQPDLISFESFSTPAAVFRYISPLVPETRPVPSTDNPSVDDLFSQSPTFPRLPQGIKAPVASSHTNISNADKNGKGNSAYSSVRAHDEEIRDPPLFPNIEREQSLAPDTLIEATQTPNRRQRRVTPFHRPEQSAGGDGLDQSSGMDVEENENSTRGHAEDMNSYANPIFLRELGSLSPTSNDLLGQLVAPPSGQPSSLPLAVPTNVVSKFKDSSRGVFPSSSSLRPPQTPLRSTSPLRFASPSRSGVLDSSNIRLRPAPLDDPNCTPARRIPIGEAVLQGHISPLKGSQLLASTSRSGSDGLQKPLIIPPTDSPARRVLTAPEISTPVMQKKWKDTRPRASTRTASKEPTGLVEPFTAEKSTGKSGATSYSARETLKPTRLPFPLVPTSQSMPATIPEDHDDVDFSSLADSTKPSQEFSSPVKSSLKQTTSRIPRTVKPYAKPPSKPQIDPTVSATETRKPPPGLGGIFHAGQDGTKVENTRIKPSVGKVGAPTTSKHKRVVAEKSSAVRPQPPEILRQVPRIIPSTSLTSSDASAVPSMVFQKKPQQIRRVIDTPVDVPFSAKPTTQVAPPLLSAMSPQKILSVPSSDVLDANRSDGKEMPAPEDVQDSNVLSSSPDPIASMAASPDMVNAGGVRRTTRIRKVLNPPSAMGTFGSSDAKTRRKPSAHTNVGDVTYSGMSATALRALTTSNTARNQRYVTVKLETKVIRKEGDRPESPMIKIKTVSQREQEEKGKDRKARAARRSRLSGEGIGPSDGLDGRSDGDSEDESDQDGSPSPVPKRHKRGPGDEEDYKTPMRKLKRLKLEDGDDAEGSEENERRVKWDRGLFTTVYFDQMKPGARRPPKENITAKGCLAPTAKTLPLDNLGNLPYADSPLTDLVEVNVVVKKFVYDNDEEPVVVKSARTRSKKGKS